MRQAPSIDKKICTCRKIKKKRAKFSLSARSKNKTQFCAQNNWTWLRGGERLWRIRRGSGQSVHVSVLVFVYELCKDYTEVAWDKTLNSKTETWKSSALYVSACDANHRPQNSNNWQQLTPRNTHAHTIRPVWELRMFNNRILLMSYCLTMCLNQLSLITLSFTLRLHWSFRHLCLCHLCVWSKINQTDVSQ